MATNKELQQKNKELRRDRDYLKERLKRSDQYIAEIKEKLYSEERKNTLFFGGGLCYGEESEVNFEEFLEMVLAKVKLYNS